MEAVESFLARIPEEMDPPGDPDIGPQFEQSTGIRNPTGPHHVGAWLRSRISRSAALERRAEALTLDNQRDLAARIRESADAVWAERPMGSRREWINRSYQRHLETYGLSGFGAAAMWMLFRFLLWYLWALYRSHPSCAPRIVI